MSDELFEGIEILDASQIEEKLEDKKSDGDSTATTKTDEIEIVALNTETATKPAEETVETQTTASNEKREAIYKSLLKEFVEGGILSLEESEELEKIPGSLDSIKDLMNKTVTKKVENSKEEWKKGFSGSKKRFLEIEENFDDSDKAIMMAERLDFLESVDEEKIKKNETLQQQLYAESLRSKGFANEKIKELVLDAIALKKLEQKASEALTELKDEASDFIEEAKVAKAQKESQAVEEQKKTFENLIAAVDSKTHFFEDLELNKAVKDKLKANMTTAVYTDPKTKKEYTSLMNKQRQNPVEFEMFINYLDVLGVFNMNKEGKFTPDLSKIKKVVKTQTITELDKLIEEESSRGVGRNTSVEQSDLTNKTLSVLKRGFKKENV